MTEIEQSLAKLAEEINQEHQAFRGAFKATFRSALRAGDLLNEAKAQAGHGDWTGWVEENCEFSMRTAQVYMRLANNREAVEKNLKSAEPAHLSIEDVLRELSSPKEYTVTIETTQEPAEEVEHRIPISLTEGVEGTKAAADAWKTSIPVTGAEEEPALSAEEEAIRERFQSGGGASVLIDMGTHKNLMEWAKRRGVFAKIDRSTDWGNPFIVDKDGDRDFCVDGFRDHYFPLKKSLHKRLSEIDAKVLGCHCYPKRCHGDVLVEQLKEQPED